MIAEITDEFVAKSGWGEHGFLETDLPIPQLRGCGAHLPACKQKGEGNLIGTTFLTAIFALCAAAAWGSGDFTGGIVARRIGTFHTMLIPYVISFIILVSTALLRREQFSQPADLMWGALAGILVMAGYGFLLRGFASGR